MLLSDRAGDIGLGIQLEAFVVKTTVQRQRSTYAESPHQDEGGAVSKAIALVGPDLEETPGVVFVLRGYADEVHGLWVEDGDTHRVSGAMT